MIHRLVFIFFLPGTQNIVCSRNLVLRSAFLRRLAWC